MKKQKMLFSKTILVSFVFSSLFLLSCKKQYTCRVDTHIEKYGLNGYPPNMKPYLSSYSDTTEFITIKSKKRDLPSMELFLSDSRIDSIAGPEEYGENAYFRTIIIKKAKCEY